MASKISTRVVKMFPRKIITPITGALALVIGITGGMLFFHLGEGLFKDVHEWLGMLFVLTMLIHILSNWNAFTQHFNQGVAKAGVASVILATGVFLGSSAFSQSEGGPNVLFKAVGEAPVASLAVLFKVDEKVLIQDLKSRGLTITESNQSISDAAVLAGVDGRDAIKLLVRTVSGIH